MNEINSIIRKLFYGMRKDWGVRLGKNAQKNLRALSYQDKQPLAVEELALYTRRCFSSIEKYYYLYTVRNERLL